MRSGRTVVVPVTIYDRDHGPVSSWDEDGRASVSAPPDDIGRMTIEANPPGLTSLAAAALALSRAELPLGASMGFFAVPGPLDPDSADLTLRLRGGTSLHFAGPATRDGDGRAAHAMSLDIPALTGATTPLRAPSGQASIRRAGHAPHGGIDLEGSGPALVWFARHLLALVHSGIRSELELELDLATPDRAAGPATFARLTLVRRAR